MKTTWLDLIKHHGLGLNNNVTYVSKLTYVATKQLMLTFGFTGDMNCGLMGERPRVCFTHPSTPTSSFTT